MGVYTGSTTLESNFPISGKLNKDMNLLSQEVLVFSIYTIETIVHSNAGARMYIRMLLGIQEGRKGNKT